MKTEELPMYWTKEEKKLLARTTTFAELTFIARIILQRMQKMENNKAIMQVCGPIANGGKGNIEDNLKEFEKAIAFLRGKGLIVFDQMPFEEPMQRIKKTMSSEESHRQIMDDFYLPLIREGYVSRYFFLPEWRTSKGSIIEHQRAEKHGVAIDYLITYQSYLTYIDTSDC